MAAIILVAFPHVISFDTGLSLISHDQAWTL